MHLIRVPACVRARSERVHAPRLCMRVRAGGGSPSGAEPSRAEQQAQAAGRAGEAANIYSSRDLKLPGEQRERRNFGEHGKSCFSPRRSSSGEPLGLFGFTVFLPFCLVPSRGAHAARTARGGRQRSRRLMKKSEAAELHVNWEI